MATTGINPDGSIRNRTDQLPRQAAMAGWGTPRVTTNGGNGSQDRATDGMSRLEDQVHGATSTSSLAGTENRGALNPAFSAWLQGFPVAWCQAAIRAHRKLDTRRKRA